VVAVVVGRAQPRPPEAPPPTPGALAFDYEVLVLADDADQRLVSWLPANETTAADTATAAAPDRTAGRRRLRVIADDPAPPELLPLARRGERLGSMAKEHAHAGQENSPKPTRATGAAPVPVRVPATRQLAASLVPATLTPATALTLQRSIGNRNVARLFVQRKARPGLPPDAWLMKAVRHSDVTGVRAALAAGADTRTVDAEGRDAVQVAFEMQGRRPGAAGARAQAVIDELIGAGGPAAAAAPPVAVLPRPTLAAIENVGSDWARKLLLELVGSVVRFNTLVNRSAASTVLLQATGTIDDCLIELESLARDLGDAMWATLQVLRTNVSARQRRLHEDASNVAGGAAPGGGGRGERHKEYTGVNAAALLQGAEKATYDAIVAKGKGQDAGKTQEEAWTAVAAKRADPGQFSRISPFDRKEIASFTGWVPGDVEYWDNAGNPWDQKTAYWDHHIDVVKAMTGVVDAISEQQEVLFPKRNSPGPAVPVGVILDCTYIDDTAYGVLWRLIHEAAAKGRIDLARLFEVKVAEIQQSGPAHRYRPNLRTAGPPANIAQLKQWATGAANGRQTIPYATLDKKVHAKLEEIVNGTGSWSVYRDMARQLPAGHVYEEYSTGALLPDGNSARFVYAPETGSLYVSGTHYHDWIDESTGQTNAGFFEVIGAPARP
jgi:hypothetical protein